MTRLSAGNRSSCFIGVWCLVGCLLFLRLVSFTLSRGVQGGKIRMYSNQLVVEELQIPSTQSGQSIQVSSLVDEFLDKNSPLRRIFFPSKRIDPRKGAGHSSYQFSPGKLWLDMDGNPIQAHGGGIMYDVRSRMYYWYGEYKDGATYSSRKGTARVDVIGVGCYSSKDLWAWKFEGIALAAEEDENHDLHKSSVLERPKVIFNERTRKYVMWMHIDDANYTKASVGIAISDSPTGPFDYLHSKRPHGFESRDMTVFKDDDGVAYVIYSSVHNREMHIGPLREDYLDVTNVMSKILVGQYREAPAVFKHKGMYYMITSGCSGWAPNEALAHVAESIMGPWQTLGNPCVGANQVFRATTFFAQSTFVLPMPGGQPDSNIFMADRWNPADLRNSRYVWLPLTVRNETEQLPQDLPSQPRVSIFWHKKWGLPGKSK